MGYCKKWIFRNMLPRLIMTLGLGLGILLFASRLPQMDQKLNELYEQQAAEMELDKPQVVADSGNTFLIYGGAGAVFLLGAFFSFSKFLFPQTSRMGRSLLRYAKYQGESGFTELLCEAERDLAHAPVFGDIAIGKEWIAGRSYPPGGQAVRLSRLCAAYHSGEAACCPGARIGTNWHPITLLDEKKRQTILLTPRQSDLMGVFHALLRRNPALLHGGEKEYRDFMDLPDEKQERLLNEVARKTYEQTYYERKE